MADRRLIIKDTESLEELILPVTPMPSAEGGVSLEIINITQLGDVALPGRSALAAPKLDCLFPAQAYPFCCAAPLGPYEYVNKFLAWAKAGTVLRFIWTNTSINLPILIESVQYEERDGTGDVYATISAREYRALNAQLQQNVVVDAVQIESEREETVNTQEQLHTVVSGDTLWGICRKYCGDGSLYPQIAAYNNIKNPNLIQIGTVIKIPASIVLENLKGVSTGTTAYTTIKYPSVPTGVQQRYSDRVLAMKEKQMGF